MKIQTFLLTVFAGAVVVGCSTYQGGVVDEPYGPQASPTMRPGMNPYDIRDPNVLTRPEPEAWGAPRPMVPQTTLGLSPYLAPGATP